MRLSRRVLAFYRSFFDIKKAPLKLFSSARRRQRCDTRFSKTIAMARMNVSFFFRRVTGTLHPVSNRAILRLGHCKDSGKKRTTK